MDGTTMKMLLLIKMILNFLIYSGWKWFSSHFKIYFKYDTSWNAKSSSRSTCIFQKQMLLCKSFTLWLNRKVWVFPSYHWKWDDCRTMSLNYYSKCSSKKKSHVFLSPSARRISKTVQSEWTKKKKWHNLHKIMSACLHKRSSQGVKVNFLTGACWIALTSGEVKRGLTQQNPKRPTRRVTP